MWELRGLVSNIDSLGGIRKRAEHLGKANPVSEPTQEHLPQVDSTPVYGCAICSELLPANRCWCCGARYCDTCSAMLARCERCDSVAILREAMSRVLPASAGDH